MTRNALRRAVAALVPLALAACGGAGATAGSAAPTPAPADERVPAGTTRAAVEAARADSARLPWTRADAEFMTHMIHHHSQAIVMARLAPGRAESPAVLRLAERIINAQQDEIVTMQQWLRDRLQPVPEPDTAAVRGVPGTAAGHTGHGGHAGHGTTGGQASQGAHAGMPGMLTPEQLRQLEQARGAEFDRLFLTYMIQHHQGAVAMVEKLFGTYGAGQDEAVFKFASDVQVDQRTEVARMQRMLLTLEWQKAEP